MGADAIRVGVSQDLEVGQVGLPLAFRHLGDAVLRKPQHPDASSTHVFEVHGVDACADILLYVVRHQAHRAWLVYLLPE